VEGGTVNLSDEPRPAFTVDFGDALLSHILDYSKKAGITKSQLVRLAVEEYLSHNNVVKKAVEKSKKPGKKETVSKLIETYNDTYYGNSSPPRQFFPALYKVYNNAVKGGLSTEDMLNIIRFSPDESLVAEGLKNGRTPSLPYLLSTGMIPRILVVVHSKVAKQERMSESEFIEHKYDVLDEWNHVIAYDKLDMFRDAIMSSKTEADIKKALNEFC
jgi:hypothetical protein